MPEAASGSDLVVVGASGHGREILDVVTAVDPAHRRWRSVGVVDDDAETEAMVVLHGAAFLGPLAELGALEQVEFVLGVGSEATRRRLDERFCSAARSPAVLIHPGATVGVLNELAPGVVVFAGATITTNVRIGRHSHLNVHASVSHDSVVGAYCTLSPGSIVAGNCTIGDGVLVGAGATVLQGRRVGDGAVVGAGAVVVYDVEPGVTVVGVPARAVELR